MKAILKEKFSEAELNSGSVLVCARNFSTVKDWSNKEVTGDKFLVSMAVKLGAKEIKKPKPKPKAKKAD